MATGTEIASRMASPEQFMEYMPFRSPEANPWDVELISGYLRTLGAADPEISLAERDQILFCYMQSSRFYHDWPHPGNVGQPDLSPPLAKILKEIDSFTIEEAIATKALAGLIHDVSCKRVDADEHGNNAWPTPLRQLLQGKVDYTSEVVNGTRIFKTKLTDAGRSDAVTQMVAKLFDVPHEGLPHTEGSDEFDSALAGALFLRDKGVQPKFIVAASAIIATTIPFREAFGVDEYGKPTDGYMNVLVERLKNVSLQIGEERFGEPDMPYIMAVGHMGVEVANRDTSSLMLPGNFAVVAEEARRLKQETLRDLRKAAGTMQELAATAKIDQSAPGFYNMLCRGEVKFKDIPAAIIMRDGDGRLLGLDHAFPPKPICDRAEKNSEENVRLSARLFAIHELGIIAAVSFATAAGNAEAPVPGFVDSDLHLNDEMIPNQPLPGVHLTRGDKAIYKELRYGTNQPGAGALTTKKSPFSAALLGAMGSRKATSLSNTVQRMRRQAARAGEQHPFSNMKRAEVFLLKVIDTAGVETFNNIVDVLIRTAVAYQDDKERGHPERAAALETARNRLIQKAIT